MQSVLKVASIGLMFFGLSASQVWASENGLWDVYDQALKKAKYVDLTHTITPHIPVWEGFSDSRFAPGVAAHDVPGMIKKGEVFSWEKQGVEVTQYVLSTDQLGTQLDPPAHWAPEYPAIDEIPPTYAVRPLVVISIVDQLKRDDNYHLQVSDILAWEKKNGRIPAGAVVFVRSDWSKKWPDPAIAHLKRFPGVSLAALQFLHEQRHILFHGHEPLDTDSTPNLEGEYWLMHHGYAQAEGVANLDQVPEKGALVAIGYAKFGGGTGGYARYIAICPPDWKYGKTIGDGDAPLPASTPLHYDEKAGMRIR